MKTTEPTSTMRKLPSQTNVPLPSLILAVFGLFLISGNASAQKWSGHCEITFSGNSTLHDFTGKVSAEPFTVTTANLDDPDRATASSSVVVKVSKMNTDNDKRDAKMMEVMDAANHPTITVDVDNLKASETEPVMEGGSPRPTVIPFSLKLKGREHQMTAKVVGWRFSGDEIRCEVAFPVSLKEAGIKPPNVLGVVKVADEIEVNAKLTLKRT